MHKKNILETLSAIFHSIISFPSAADIGAKKGDKIFVFVAYSGGVDSHVLLHSLVKLKQSETFYDGIKIFAIHINHGIYQAAGDWQKHCQEICAGLQVPCIVKEISVKENLKRKESLEALARKMRYQAFSEIILNEIKASQGKVTHTILLTAHHADDEAETLLLQLLRGAGPKGLAAIPAKSKLDGKIDIDLLRPLLSFSRDEILQYAKENNLNWIEDESNLDLSFDRNYLRHGVIPLLKTKWLGMLQTLGRVAANCYEAHNLTEILAKTDYAMVQSKAHGQKTLSVSKLLKLEPLRQRNVLRYFVQLIGLPMPSRAKVEEIWRTVLLSSDDAQPLVVWRGAEVRRYQGNLYIMPPLLPHDANIVLKWNLEKSLVLPNQLGVLKAQFISREMRKKFFADLVLSDDAAKSKMFSVKFRCGGERCKLKGKQHSASLKKLWQEWQVPPWLRSRIPLLYKNDEIVMVVGYCECEGWIEGIRIVWKY